MAQLDQLWFTGHRPLVRDLSKRLRTPQVIRAIGEGDVLDGGLTWRKFGQRQTVAVPSASLSSGAGTALTSTDTFDGYTLAQVVAALRTVGLLA